MVVNSEDLIAGISRSITIRRDAFGFMDIGRPWDRNRKSYFFIFLGFESLCSYSILSGRFGEVLRCKFI